MKSEKINDKLNVLYIIPRYRTYGMEGHYVMPMGILYVSAYVKRSGIANVFTLNLNHESGEEFDILQSYIKKNNIDFIDINDVKITPEKNLPEYYRMKKLYSDEIFANFSEAATTVL